MSKALTVDVPAAVVEKVTKAAKDVEIKVARFAAEEQQKFLAEVRPELKKIKGFWTVAMLNCPAVSGAATASDREALKSLEDIELIQDPKDPRAYELIFHFGENDFFTNKTLSKKYSLPEGAKPAPADGTITDEIREFDEEDLVAEPTKVDWKDGKNLVELHPRKVPTEEDLDALENDDFEGDVGSWFHYFTAEGDMFDVGQMIVNTILSDPYAAFDAMEEDDELDEEDDDDDEGSVDLEAEEEDGPARKKQKN